MENRINHERLPVRIRTSGLVENVPFHSTPGTKDGDWMLTVFLGGEGTYRNSQGEIPITAGMAGLVNFVDPGILLSNSGNPYHHFYCRFQGAFANSLCLDILKREVFPFFKSSQYLDVAECLRKMGHRHSKELSNDFGQNEALLLQALSLLHESTAGEHDTPLTWDHVEHYLQLHLSRTISLTETADHFHISRASFCRMIRKTTGDTFQHKLEALRMDWACRLLEDTPLYINQVAERIGYTDPLYFSKVFRKHMGLSPRKWQIVNRRNKKSSGINIRGLK